MLHYSVDNELMSDLYRDYRQMKGAEYAQLHELGEHYLSLIEGYDLEESTIKTLQGLVQFETEEELDCESSIKKRTGGIQRVCTDVRR